ncbi:kynureninase [Radiobacillus sp. PE A8.2]|uniref:kynureninase n=1 Tax=Radiobacillus sp. PE A8.2 TaxID=3380349 RepID=UPI0038903F1B
MEKEHIFSLEYARSLDDQDQLKAYRQEFYIPTNKIYFDGNSLGLLSKRAEKSVAIVMEAWKQLAIDGWTEGEHPWYYFSEALGEKMAPLVGAESTEVIVTGSTTVNLHQLVASFYKPSKTRTKIVADELNFPSDIYALQSQLQLKRYDHTDHLIYVTSKDGSTLDEADIIEAMTDDVALIVLPSVLYRSGQLLDIQRLTAAAHERDIKIGFDLCHSIGAIPHELHEWGVDFAFWCNYKHLNAGPGSVAGIFVHERHFGQAPGLAGWFSSTKEKQFDMEHHLTPAVDAGAYQIGTPHLLSSAPLLGSLELFQEAGIDQIRNKSLQLTDYLLLLVKQELQAYSFTVDVLPAERRGAHILLNHKEAARICKALKAGNVIPDFRSPNSIRLAPVALYNTFTEVYETVHKLKKIMEEKTYKTFPNERGVVA